MAFSFSDTCVDSEDSWELHANIENTQAPDIFEKLYRQLSAMKARNETAKPPKRGLGSPEWMVNLQKMHPKEELDVHASIQS